MKEVFEKAKTKMGKTVSALKSEYAGIRAGRANPQILDKLTVDYYGTPTPVGQLASVSVSEAAELLTVSMPVISLTSQDKSTSRQLDIPTEAPQEALSEKLALKKVVSLLEERDRKLIELRYFEGMTQVRTAQRLGMSQVQVSRREKALLIKMRESLLG